jgi:uncharacterized protein YdhG (YjbR/CyaY superfamily)
VSAREVDEYLRGVGEPKRSTREALRGTILEIVPEAEQVISYRVPAFRVDGKVVAGSSASATRAAAATAVAVEAIRIGRQR